MAPTSDRRFVVAGPIGALEAVDTGPHAAATALICHPHPQLGGSLDDAVVAVARDAALAAGMRVVRFNFRGVGASDGVHDGGEGEVDDVVAVLDALDSEAVNSKAENSKDAHFEDAGSEDVTLIGYSFGAVMAWRAAHRHRVGRLILISPPLLRMPVEGPPPSDRTTVVYGRDDPFVERSALGVVMSAGVDGRAVDGADHFFTGRRDALRKALGVCL